MPQSIRNTRLIVRTLICVAALSLVLPDRIIRAQEAPKSAAEATENAPPVRISPDDPGSLQRGIEAAYKAGLKQVTVSPGTYRVDNTLAFTGMSDLAIEARGVTLLRTDATKRGIEFVRCRNVTLRGMTLLPETVPFTQGRLEKIDPAGSWFDIRIAQGYPSHYLDKKPAGHVFDPRTRQWKPQTPDFYFKRIEPLGAGLFRLHLDNPFDRGLWRVEAGDLMAFRGPGPQDIYLAQCSGMNIAGVTIRSGSGFCIHEDGGEGGNRYSYTVTYGPKPKGATERPLMACNADAFHSANARRGPTLENCLFEGMCDDGVPIHGYYAMVVEADGKGLVVVTQGETNLFRGGDPLRLFDPQGVLLGEATVVSSAPLDGYQPKAMPQDKHFKERKSFFRLTLDRELPAAFECRVSNPAACGSGFVVRNCTVRNHRARGMLIKADNGLIEGNTIEGSTIAGLIIAPEYWWNEACCARNIAVRNNTFRRCGYATNGPWDARPGVLTIAGEGDKKGIAYGNQHILIENNTFLDNDGVNLMVHDAQDVRVRNNRFVRAQRQPTRRGADRIDPGYLIWVSHADDVRFAGNTVENLGPNNKALIGTTAVLNLVGQDGGVKKTAK